MNILKFFTPKSSLSYLYSTYTLRQAMEKMELNRYTAIPVIDKRNRYVGTLTEGDLLWYIKSLDLSCLRDAENYYIKDIEPHLHYHPVRIDADLRDIITASLEQNFVPVVDDRDKFIGIITRKKIIQYFSARYQEKISEKAEV